MSFTKYRCIKLAVAHHPITSNAYREVRINKKKKSRQSFRLPEFKFWFHGLQFDYQTATRQRFSRAECTGKLCMAGGTEVMVRIIVNFRTPNDEGK